MSVLIALFRGINVGGHHTLPMQDLRAIFETLGCEDVRTYIQSGNAVFRTGSDPDSLARHLGDAVDERFGFRPGVLILDVESFRAIAAANPYSAAEQTPSHLHVLFLGEAPSNPDLDTLERLQAPSEAFELVDDAFYLHAPDGIGRSKLAAGAEKALGVAATGRNWRTVSKLVELADAIIGRS